MLKRFFGSTFIPLVLIAASTAWSADTVNLTFGVLPPGKSSTVTIKATIINTPSSVSNQGTVSGTNFSSVLTDDPGVGGATDPTVIAVGAPCPVISLAALNNSIVGASYTGSVAASGGTGPYAYTQTGLLPTGVTRTVDALSGTTAVECIAVLDLVSALGIGIGSGDGIGQMARGRELFTRCAMMLAKLEARFR